MLCFRYQLAGCASVVGQMHFQSHLEASLIYCRRVVKRVSGWDVNPPQPMHTEGE